MILLLGVYPAYPIVYSAQMISTVNNVPQATSGTSPDVQNQDSLTVSSTIPTELKPQPVRNANRDISFSMVVAINVWDASCVRYSFYARRLVCRDLLLSTMRVWCLSL